MQADKSSMFKKADKDGDGRISHNDFEDFLKANAAEGLVDVFKVEFLSRSEVLARKKKWKPKVKKVEEKEKVNDNRV